MMILRTALVLLSAAGLITFPIAYHFTSGGLWRYSRVGRSLMQFMAVLAAVMVLTVATLISRALGHGRLPDWVGIVVWGFIAFVAWRQVWVLFKVRNRPAPEA